MNAPAYAGKHNRELYLGLEELQCLWTNWNPLCTFTTSLLIMCLQLWSPTALCPESIHHHFICLARLSHTWCALSWWYSNERQCRCVSAHLSIDINWLESGELWWSVKTNNVPQPVVLLLNNCERLKCVALSKHALILLTDVSFRCAFSLSTSVPDGLMILHVTANNLPAFGEWYRPWSVEGASNS